VQTKVLKKNNLSPFSVLCGYKIDICNTLKRNDNLILSNQEQAVVKIIKSLDAVASFQLEDLMWTKNTARRKLRRLSNYNIIGRYKLIGDYTLNVYTMNKLSDVDKVLRTLALNQLYIKMLKLAPCSMLKSEKPLDAYIKFKEITFSVMVVRGNDNTKTLPFIVSTRLLTDINRLIIISEEFYPEYKTLDGRVRITTDRDLIERPLFDAFYLPDGRRDNAKIFDVHD